MVIKYDNQIKSTARGWIWNQLSARLPKKPNRKYCRIFTLIGETSKELDVACKKGFSPFNIIGVDLKKKSIAQWRKNGGIGVQLPLDLAVMASKIKPHAVVCDFCGGITKTNFNTLWLVFMRIQAPGALVVNMLRGRDADVKKIRTWELKTIMRQFGFDKFNRGHLIYANMLCDSWAMIGRYHVSMNFSDFVETLNRQLNPAFYTYRSADTGRRQVFDSMVLSFPQAMEIVDDGPHPLDTVAELGQRIKMSQEPRVIRRMAAVEAIRTMKIRDNGGKLLKFIE